MSSFSFGCIKMWQSVRIKLSFFPTEVDGVPSEEMANATSCGMSEIINGTVPIIAEDQPTATDQCDTGGVQLNLNKKCVQFVLTVWSLLYFFSLFPELNTSALDGTIIIPIDSAVEINASNGQAGIQELSSISEDDLSTATHPNNTEISSSTASTSDRTPGEQDVPKEHKTTTQVISAELQNGNTERTAPIIATEPVTASNQCHHQSNVTMELVKTVTNVSANYITTSEVTDQRAEPVTEEPVTAAEDATMEVMAVVQDAATMPEVAAQGIAIQPVTPAQDDIREAGTVSVDVPSKSTVSGLAAKDDVTKQSVNTELVTEVATQFTTAVLVMASEDVPKDSMVVPEDVTADPVGGGPANTVKHRETEHGVTSVLEVTAECGIRKTVADAEDVTTIITTEAATQGAAAKEPSPSIHGISTNPVAVPQEITAELVATGQDAITIKHEAQGITTELGMTMKPDAAVENIPKEFAPTIAQHATDLSNSSATGQNETPDQETGNLTVETQKPQGVNPSDEPTTALKMTVNPVMLPQDTNSETNTAQGITSVTVSEAQIFSRPEIQDVTTGPVTKGHEVTSEDQSVSEELIPASPDATKLTATEQYGESVTAEQDVTTVCIPAAEDDRMETTEAGEGVALQPAVTDKSIVPMESTAEHGPMELDAGSEKMTTEPAETVQDVGVESQNESKGVAQDVTMEPVTEIQDVPMDLTEDLKAVPQNTGLKADVQDLTDQVMEPAENGTCESKVLVSDSIDKAVPAGKIGSVQATTATKDATCDANNSTAAEVKHATVKDDLDQSYAIPQDGTDPSKGAAQAAAVEVDAIEPHKGVLSYYSTPAQEAFFCEIQNAKFFSIVCEQQIEIEGHTYIPVGICYLEKRKTPSEDVLAYVPLEQDVDVFVDSIAAALSEKWGLNLALCRGQSLLTVGAAGAQVRGAASLLSQRYPCAVRTLSSSVSLNTWLAKSCIISEIADSYSWVERMLQWVTEDEEKRAILHRMVASLFQNDAVKHSDLTDRLSRSQWERSHDTLDLTVEVLEAVMLSLNDIKENHEIQAERTQAGDFLLILQNFEFILTLVIMKNVLGPTKSLSRNFQGQPLDVYQAVNSLSEVLSSLSDMKTNIDGNLQIWYQEAVVFASKLQISVDHASQECLIIYCRDIVSKGAIDHSICEITELFSDCTLSAVRCMQVVPYVISETEGCCTDPELFMAYRDDLPDPSSLQAELLKWREKWLDTDVTQQPLPASLLDTLNATDAESFPNIEALLRLLMVLPCFRKEDLIRQGKKSLIEFNQQRSLLELYPL